MRHLKREFDKLTFKEVLTYTLAFMSMIAAFVLLFMGMLIDPEGEIHSSVLYAFGLMLAFVSTLLGLSMHYGAENDKFKAEILSFVKNMGKEDESEQ